MKYNIILFIHSQCVCCQFPINWRALLLHQILHNFRMIDVSCTNFCGTDGLAKKNYNLNLVHHGRKSIVKLKNIDFFKVYVKSCLKGNNTILISFHSHIIKDNSVMQGNAQLFLH